MTERALFLRSIGENDYSVIREGRDIGRIRATYHHVKRVEEWSWSTENHDAGRNQGA